MITKQEFRKKYICENCGNINTNKLLTYLEKLNKEFEEFNNTYDENMNKKEKKDENRRPG